MSTFILDTISTNNLTDWTLQDKSSNSSSNVSSTKTITVELSILLFLITKLAFMDIFL